MKVVLFCGGFGTRLRDYSESIPKPMVKLGNRPILWHIMRYYAHFGHKEFILCLGWKADAIKQYFLNYDECISNNFVMSRGGESIKLLNNDIQDWRITFVDTGSASNIGQRLKAVQPHVEGEETFLANYSDGLSDLPLPELVDFHNERNAVATFLSVKPSQTFHAVSMGEDGIVDRIREIRELDCWMNGGYFVFSQQIFDYLYDGEELIEEPFSRLIDAGRLCSMKYDGFWSCMDTYKDKQRFDDMYSRGETPWKVWEESNRGPIGLPAPDETGPGFYVPKAR